MRKTHLRPTGKKVLYHPTSSLYRVPRTPYGEFFTTIFDIMTYTLE